MENAPTAKKVRHSRTQFPNGLPYVACSAKANLLSPPIIPNLLLEIPLTESSECPNNSSMRLAEYRLLKGLTQSDLAEALDLSKSRVSEIESGSGCSLNTALRIEAYTNGAVRPQDLRRTWEPTE